MNETMQRVLDFKIVAHRGCWSLRAPENSLAALKLAVERGFAIELDVHLLSDGGIAVFHDSSLVRMCFRRGRIEDLTCTQLRKFKLRCTKQYIPQLKEVFELVDGKVPIYIELKAHGDAIPLADALIRETENYKGDFVFIGFDQEAGAYLKGKGYTVGFSCVTPPNAMPYSPDCMICHIVGVPKNKELREQYPPFVPWTIITPFGRKKARTSSPAAMYNTRYFPSLSHKCNRIDKLFNAKY